MDISTLRRIKYAGDPKPVIRGSQKCAQLFFAAIFDAANLQKNLVLYLVYASSWKIVLVSRLWILQLFLAFSDFLRGPQPIKKFDPLGRPRNCKIRQNGIPPWII